MRRTRYLMLHGIQTIIYIILAILMTAIRDKNIEDPLFAVFHGFSVVMALICVIIWIVILLVNRGDNDEE